MDIKVWFYRWLATVGLSLVVVAGLADGETERQGRVIILAVSMCVVGALLMPKPQDQSLYFPALLAWCITLAIGSLLITVAHLSGIQEVTMMFCAVVLQATLFTLLMLTVRHKAIFLLVVGTLAAAPLYLGHTVRGQPQALVDAVIALSPVSHLAAALEYDYLKSAWFYRHTPYGGLRYGELNAGITALSYAAICTVLGALCAYKNKLKFSLN